jgi:cytochrome c-type biogenesis protein CcmH
MIRLCLHFAFWLAIATTRVFAAAPAASDRFEDEARAIEDNLIAPCCWSQPVSQHQSAAAEEIRQGVREMLAAGKSREEILDHFVAIHGERILATPRPRGFNILVYILPWVALILGTLFVAVVVRRLRAARPAPPASPVAPAGYAEAVEREVRDLE